MLDQVLLSFDIHPDVDLNLMQVGQSLASFSSQAMVSLDAFLAREMPDLIVVQGDTTTVLCAALAAFYRRIPIAHVEAGLRTWNLNAPWPEEANRVLVSRLARLHFAPTERNRQNLLREGIPPDTVFVTGNTVVDALFMALDQLKKADPAIPGLNPEAATSMEEGRAVLITGHRRESFGEGFQSICTAIVTLSKRFPDMQFIYPVHLNPQVRQPVTRMLTGHDNIHLIEPLSYLPFVKLMRDCRLVLTDSGGIQEEAPSLGKPVLVMRDATERPEAVEAGGSKLVGTNPARIEEAVSVLLIDPVAYDAMAKAGNPYGDGHAAERIVAIIRNTLQQLQAR